MWSTLLDAASDFPRLRVALCSGAGLAPALAMRLTAQAEQAWNLHGPTEAAGWAIAYRLDPMPDPTATPDAQADAGDLMPIGWPLANLYALVVNEHGLPVPDGGHGELWLSGLGLARGYRGKAALTSQCFPESGPVGERCFRGGTRVRRDTQGALHWAPSSRPAAAVGAMGPIGATPRARRRGLMAVLCGLLRRSNRLRAAAGTLLGAERCHRPGR